MINKPVHEWNKATLQWLIDNQISESIHIEYKRELKVKSVGDKKELCKDVSAMANAFGGQIFFGIEETKQKDAGSIPKDLMPIQDKSLKEIMEQVLLDGILPRIDYRLFSIEDTEKCGEYIIIDIPQSMRGPHFVCSKGENRFYKRREFQAKPMDQREIEDAYRNFFYQEMKMKSLFDQIKQENPNKDLEPSQRKGFCSIYFIPQYPVFNLFYKKFDAVSISDCLTDLTGLYLGGNDNYFINSYEGFTKINTLNELTQSKSTLFRNSCVNIYFSLFMSLGTDIYIPFIDFCENIQNTLKQVSSLFQKCGYLGNLQIKMIVGNADDYVLLMKDLPRYKTRNTKPMTFSLETNIVKLKESYILESLKFLIPFAQSYGYSDMGINTYLKSNGYDITVSKIYNQYL